MSLHGLSLLAGTPGQTGGKIFRAVNPATSTLLKPDFHEASNDEVAQALDEMGDGLMRRLTYRLMLVHQIVYPILLLIFGGFVAFGDCH